MSEADYIVCKISARRVREFIEYNTNDPPLTEAELDTLRWCFSYESENEFIKQALRVLKDTRQ